MGDYLFNDASVIAANNDIAIKANRFDNTAYTVDLKEVTRVDKSWLRRRSSGGGTKKKYYTYTTISTSETGIYVTVAGFAVTVAEQEAIRIF